MAAVRMIAITGVMLAVTFVLTRSVTFSIGPGGFVHMGDIAVFVTAILFSPIVALVAGGLGTSLADVSLGYGAWAPGTLVIHGLRGFAARHDRLARAGRAPDGHRRDRRRRDSRRRLLPLRNLIFILAGLLDGEEGKTAFAVARRQPSG
ncbi:MAG: ECF transporter S component [Thermomicrobiales bacterium]